jgi:cyclopropane-fatty-acyl-phospholipid synthase
MMLTSTKNQTDLPRYFAQVFNVAQSLENGRLDLTLGDGRIFRVEGRHPGPTAVIEVHNPDLFARLIREGDLGFSEAYMDGWWTSPNLQAFMDLLRVGNDALYDGFSGMGRCAPSRTCGTGCAGTQSGRRARTSPRITTLATISTDCGWMRR